MDAKICDICGATYVPPITRYEKTENVNKKRKKFGWINSFIDRKMRKDGRLTYEICFARETTLINDGQVYCTTEKLDICPRCSNKICEFIDKLYGGE